MIVYGQADPRMAAAAAADGMQLREASEADLKENVGLLFQQAVLTRGSGPVQAMIFAGASPEEITAFAEVCGFEGPLAALTETNASWTLGHLLEELYKEHYGARTASQLREMVNIVKQLPPQATAGTLDEAMRMFRAYEASGSYDYFAELTLVRILMEGLEKLYG